MVTKNRRKLPYGTNVVPRNHFLVKQRNQVLGLGYAKKPRNLRNHLTQPSTQPNFGFLRNFADALRNLPAQEKKIASARSAQESLQLPLILGGRSLRRTVSTATRACPSPDETGPARGRAYRPIFLFHLKTMILLGLVELPKARGVSVCAVAAPAACISDRRAKHGSDRGGRNSHPFWPKTVHRVIYNISKADLNIR